MKESRFSVRGLIVTLAVVTGLSSVTACSSEPKASVGLIDTARITNNWPKFQNYQNQIVADEAAIQRSRASNAQKAQQIAQLQQRFVSAQRELTDDVSNAAQQVAKDKGLSFVFTRQYVGYGGIDITGDIEKILKIDEKATPAP
jgi:Skp family chaperone for outer membrane proteins